MVWDISCWVQTPTRLDRFFMFHPATPKDVSGGAGTFGKVLSLCKRGAGINHSTGLISYGSNVKMLLVTEPIDAEKVMGHLSYLRI